MSSRKLLIKNVSWNWFAFGLETVVGFIMVPLLLSRLGADSYGLWILLASFTGYFNSLDLGVRLAVGRSIAKFSSNDNPAMMQQAFRFGLRFLRKASLVVLILTFIGALIFPYLFSGVDYDSGQLRLAAAMVGLNLALTFFFMGYEAALWGHQRFEIIGMSNVSGSFLRLGLTYALIHNSTDIITLAGVTLASTVLIGLSKLISLRIVSPSILGGNHTETDSEVRQEIIHFAGWSMVGRISGAAASNSVPVAIGIVLGPVAVAAYAIPNRLIKSYNALISTSIGVLVPFSAASSRDETKLVSLFIPAGAIMVCFGAFVTLLCLLFGEQLLELWVGSSVIGGANIALILSILAVGEMIANLSTAGEAIILGKGRNREIALMHAAQFILLIILIPSLSSMYGLIGAALAYTSTRVLLHGVLKTWFVCYLLKQKSLKFALNSFVVGFALVVPSGFVMWGASQFRAVDNWFSLFAIVGIGATVLMTTIILTMRHNLKFARVRVTEHS